MEIAEADPRMKTTNRSEREPMGSMGNSSRVLMSAKVHNNGSSQQHDNIDEDWPVGDDLALISSIVHTGDIEYIAKAVKFSKKYTTTELEKRWFDLMYDDEAHNRAKQRFSRCPPEVFNKAQANVPLSLAEKFFVDAQPLNQLSDAEKLILANRTTFLLTRTPQQLLDQSKILSMSKAARKAPRLAPFDVRLKEPSTSAESASSHHRKDIPNCPDRPFLRGKNAIFPLHQDHVVIGRSTPTSKVDVNLSEEGPAAKIARKQAVLARDTANEFKITNTGRRPMIVDGKVLFEGNFTLVMHNSVIEIANIRLVFKCNC